jgi:hypothetical protein
MLLFILHPAREIVTALPAVMLLFTPEETSVESNSLALFPTLSAEPPLATKRQRRAVPVNVPLYTLLFIVQSVNVPVAEPPNPLPNPFVATEHLTKVPDGKVNPKLEEQSVKVPEAVPPNATPVDVHRVNVPDAVPAPPNDSVPDVQSSNTPDAIAVDVGDPASVPPKDESPPTHLRYVPEYSIPYRIPEPDVPLNTQFSIYVRLSRSVAVPMLPAALTVEG